MLAYLHHQLVWLHPYAFLRVFHCHHCHHCHLHPFSRTWSCSTSRYSASLWRRIFVVSILSKLKPSIALSSVYWAALVFYTVNIFGYFFAPSTSFVLTRWLANSIRLQLNFVHRTIIIVEELQIFYCINISFVSFMSTQILCEFFKQIDIETLNDSVISINLWKLTD